MSGNEDHHRQGRRFAARGNRHDERDPRDVEIERLRQRVRLNLKSISSIDRKDKIPEFEGRLCPDDFLDWLRTVDRIFDLRDTPDHIKRINEEQNNCTLALNVEKPAIGKKENNTLLTLIDEVDPLYDTEDEAETEVVYPDRGELLVTRRLLNTAVLDQDDDTTWLRTNIFRTQCTSKGKVCTVIIDGGSCENMVSTTMVEKLGLPIQNHPDPYQLTWRYSTYDKEFYAIVRSLEYWRHYLLPAEFILYSDHEALKFIQGQAKLKPRHAKWVETLQDFSFVIRHKAGSANSDDLVFKELMGNKCHGGIFRDFCAAGWFSYSWGFVYVFRFFFDGAIILECHRGALAGHFGRAKTAALVLSLDFKAPFGGVTKIQGYREQGSLNRSWLFSHLDFIELIGGERGDVHRSTIVPTIPPIAPTIQYTSPFICTDLSDSDTSERPPSQDPYEVTVARWRSQPIPVGRPYRTQPNGVLQMLTVRKSVGPVPTHQLALRYTMDYSSSDHFTSDDSSQDSLSKTSLDSHSETLSDSSSRHSFSGYAISDSLCDPPTAISARPYRKRCRSLTTLVPAASPVPRALSPVRADLLPPHKRIKDSDSVTDFEVSLEVGFVSYVPREIGLGIDVEDSYEPYTELDIDPDVQADIDACIAFVDDIASRWMDVRVKIRTMVEEEAKSSARGTIEIGVDRLTHPVVSDDTAKAVRENFPELVSADESLEVMQRGLDVVMHELYDHMVEIPVHRVRVIESVQRDQRHRIVATSQQSAAMSVRIGTLEQDNRRLIGMLDVERQRIDRLWHSMLYVQRDLWQIRRFRFYDRVRTMPTATHFRMTQDAINELISKRVEEALKAYDTAKNDGTEMEMKNEQQDDNVEANGDNGNGNGNGNGNPNGTEGVVGLTRWFKKMEMLFHISNCPPKYQVKDASCTLLDGALTWWNSHKRTVRVDATYAMTWKALIKIMTEVYCPRNEIHKIETELWNLTVKGNDLTAYNQRFQELTMLCTKMVPKEEDKVEKYIGGLPDNIQGNVIAIEPIRLRDAIRIANNLMDQKLMGYAIKNVENKRRKAYAGNLPYCNKFRMHHEGPCTVKCSNCKRVGHMTRDCKAAVAATAQRAPVGNQTRNKTGNNEAKARAYAIGGGGANPDSNVVTGMFLLNNCYSTMLFDSGADRSFVSTTFSALLDVILSTLDVSYAVELADGRILKTNVILRGCTLGLLSHPFDIDLMLVELGSFNVIVGMDWLAKYHVVIICDEKIVRIPYGDEVLVIEGGGCNSGSKSKLSIISCTKTQKYIQKGYQVYLAQVRANKTDDKSEEKRLEDVPIVRDFLEVFLEDLSGLPPT
ncbi:putative reverse transcriptase domain-containing protein [Tanacetum coccineum]